MRSLPPCWTRPNSDRGSPPFHVHIYPSDLVASVIVRPLVNYGIPSFWAGMVLMARLMFARIPDGENLYSFTTRDARAVRSGGILDWGEEMAAAYPDGLDGVRNVFGFPWMALSSLGSVVRNKGMIGQSSSEAGFPGLFFLRSGLTSFFMRIVKKESISMDR